MAEYLATDSDLTSVANAIRTKTGLSVTLEFPSDFITAIANIPTGITPTGTISITQNGTVDVTNYATADVNVSNGGGVSTVKCGEITAASVGMITIDTKYSGNGFPLGFAIFQMGGVNLSSSDVGITLYAKINNNTTAPSQYSTVYSLTFRGYSTGSSGQTVDRRSAVIFTQNAAADNANLCAVMSSADTLKAYFGNTETSFKTNVRYCWVVAYSE